MDSDWPRTGELPLPKRLLKLIDSGLWPKTADEERRQNTALLVSKERIQSFAPRVQALLEEGLALRDRYKNQEISLHGLWTATGRLEAKLDRLLARPYRDSANRRLAKHLQHERPYIFTYLYCPGLDATNNVAERAVRALIGARKNWGETAPRTEPAPKPCSPAFCKPPNDRATILSMS